MSTEKDAMKKAVAWEPGVPDIEYRTRALGFAIAEGSDATASDIVRDAAEFEEYLRNGHKTKSAPEETTVAIPRYRLNGWDTGKGLSGAEWRAYIEALPAGEFATTLLALADGIDQCDRTGMWAPNRK